METTTEEQELVGSADRDGWLEKTNLSQCFFFPLKKDVIS